MKEWEEMLRTIIMNKTKMNIMILLEIDKYVKRIRIIITIIIVIIIIIIINVEYTL